MAIASLRPHVIVATVVLTLALAAPADSSTNAINATNPINAINATKATGTSSAPGTTAIGKTVVVARSTLAETRVWLTVRRTSRYNAVMRVHMSVLRHGTWHAAGSLRVGTVFWYVATGRGGLCTFSTGESAPSRRASPPVVMTRPVVVRPLVTPAIGCGKARSFHYHRGELVRGR